MIILGWFFEIACEVWHKKKKKCLLKTCSFPKSEKHLFITSASHKWQILCPGIFLLPSSGTLCQDEYNSFTVLQQKYGGLGSKTVNNPQITNIHLLTV